MTSYFRVGGLSMDLPLGFLDYIKNFAAYFPDRIEQYSDLLTNNPIWLGRTKGVALITKEDALELMLSGPTARGSGVDWDLRRDMPYGGYDKLEFKVPVETAGDVYARYQVRMGELARVHQHGQAGHRESARRPDQGRCAQGCPARSREDEDADGIAHPSLQDRHRRIHGSGRRGLPGRGIAARRDGLLRRLRRHGQALSRAYAQPILRQPERHRSDVRTQPAGRRGRRHRQHRYRPRRRETR